MRRWWLAISISIWIISSATIAYVLVFVTPWFGGKYSGNSHLIGIDYSWDMGDTIAPSSIDYYSKWIPGDVQELAKRQPAEVQKVVKELWSDLIKKSDPDLYILKSLPDVCLGEIDCRDLESKDVKPFIEAALALRQTLETATIAWRSLYVAAGSLFVSFLSVGFAALTLARRKRPARPTHPGLASL
jgi:hypothetical protein